MEVCMRQAALSQESLVQAFVACLGIPCLVRAEKKRIVYASHRPRQDLLRVDLAESEAEVPEDAAGLALHV